MSKIFRNLKAKGQDNLQNTIANFEVSNWFTLTLFYSWTYFLLNNFQPSKALKFNRQPSSLEKITRQSYHPIETLKRGCFTTVAFIWLILAITRPYSQVTVNRLLVLLVNSRPTLFPFILRKLSVACWSFVGRQLVVCLPTVYRRTADRFLGELFFNFADLGRDTSSVWNTLYVISWGNHEPVVAPQNVGCFLK